MSSVPAPVDADTPDPNPLPDAQIPRLSPSPSPHSNQSPPASPASSVSALPRRRASPVKSGDAISTQDAALIVHQILRKVWRTERTHGGQVTISKFVRVVRTEHFFLLFQELGKRDRWLQCLEVVGMAPPVKKISYWNHAIKRELVPNASTYKLLYKAYAKANTKELINNLLKHVGAQGIVPNKFFWEDLKHLILLKRDLND